MTFVKVKLKLEQMSVGDRLEVLLTEGEPLNNVPKSARQQGCKVLSITPDKPPFHRVVIEK